METSNILRFVLSHGLSATRIGTTVRFVCADGELHTVRTMGAARRVLGY